MPALPDSDDDVLLFESVGMRPDVPHAVVKAIVAAVEARDRSDADEVELALSSFNVIALLKPGVSVATFAERLVELARSGKWPSPPAPASTPAA